LRRPPDRAYQGGSAPRGAQPSDRRPDMHPTSRPANGAD
jgi:hypothetical protein